MSTEHRDSSPLSFPLRIVARGIGPHSQPISSWLVHWTIKSPCRIRHAPSFEDRGLCGTAERDRESGGAVSSLQKLSSGGLTPTPTNILLVLFRELPAPTSGE